MERLSCRMHGLALKVARIQVNLHLSDSMSMPGDDEMLTQLSTHLAAWWPWLQAEVETASAGQPCKRYNKNIDLSNYGRHSGFQNFFTLYDYKFI
jgi:hypothetical protein